MIDTFIDLQSREFPIEQCCRTMKIPLRVLRLSTPAGEPDRKMLDDAESHRDQRPGDAAASESSGPKETASDLPHVGLRGSLHPRLELISEYCEPE